MDIIFVKLLWIDIFHFFLGQFIVVVLIWSIMVLHHVTLPESIYQMLDLPCGGSGWLCYHLYSSLRIKNLHCSYKSIFDVQVFCSFFLLLLIPSFILSLYVKIQGIIFNCFAFVKAGYIEVTIDFKEAFVTTENIQVLSMKYSVNLLNPVGLWSSLNLCQILV